MGSRKPLRTHTFQVGKMENPQITLSIIVPIYNVERYLKKCIDSLLNQDISDYEIILVDDASTDNSKELYKELEKDERIHIYLNEQNMGCGYTKRRCAELATGEICGFLDPDDVLTNEALEIMVDAHLQHPEASLIHSNHYDCDENLNIQSVYHGEQIPDNECFLKFQHGVSHFATFKRDLYDKTIGINPSMSCAVDMDLYYLLEEVGTFVYISHVLYYYRRGTGLNISLGENVYKAFAWDTIAQYNAALRRKWDVDKEFCPIVVANIKYLTKVISDEKVLEKEISIRQSITYKIGRLFTRPLKWLIK